jgi:hypothetical protein
MLAGVAWAQEELPNLEPSVQSVFPRGAARGVATELELRGDNLAGLTEIEVAGRGVRAEVLSAHPSHARVRVVAASDAEAGRRDFRVRGPQGTYVGALEIGARPELDEAEPNGDWRKPQPLELPAVVNGIVDTEDFDHFAFEAAAGRTYVFHVLATRNGSRLDADLAVLDSAGHELLWNDDDTIFGDPHLEFTPGEAGRYVLRVGSLAGNRNADYRLAAGSIPFVRHTLPAGLQRGVSTEIALRGVNLDRVTEVRLGDREATGEIVRQSPKELVVRLTAPDSAEVGARRLHLETADGESPLAPGVWVSELREVTAAAPHSLEAALPIEGPVIVNGALSCPKQRHFFRFEARAGDSYDFRVDSMRLEYHLDPTLTLLDAEGRKLAYADDPGIDMRTDEYQLDPRLSYRFTEDGVYYAVVRDGMFRGREDFVYRLTVAPSEPYFTVELRDSLPTVLSGQQASLHLRVRRAAGWDAPVEVWAEGLPPGVTAERRTAAPEDSVVKDTCGVELTIDGTIVDLPLRASADAVGRAPFVVKAAGEWNGKHVERTAAVFYERLAAGYLYGPMQVQRAELTVAPAPRVLLTVPESMNVAASEPIRIPVGVRRFLDLRDSDVTVRVAGLPEGWNAAAVTVSASQRDAVIELEGPGAPSSAGLRGQALVGEELVAESTPIAIQVRRPDDGGVGDKE